MTYIKTSVKRIVLMALCLQLLCAWTIGVKPTDVTSELNFVKSCTVSVATTLLGYTKGDAPTECHRWGLKWSFEGVTSTKVLTSLITGDSPATGDDNNPVSQAWHIILKKADPIDDGARRLPTIKELVRIFEYNNDNKSTAGVPATDHTFRAWLQADDGSKSVLDGYLITSTYRHINSTSGNNGEVDGSRKKIRYLGIEIGTGKVVAFNAKLFLCESLIDSDNGTNVDADCIKPSPAVSVYAFYVGPLG